VLAQEPLVEPGPMYPVANCTLAEAGRRLGSDYTGLSSLAAGLPAPNALLTNSTTSEGVWICCADDLGFSVVSVSVFPSLNRTWIRVTRSARILISVVHV